MIRIANAPDQLDPTINASDNKKSEKDIIMYIYYNADRYSDSNFTVI